MTSHDSLENLIPRSAHGTIRGVSFPAIIRNGSYFLADLYVFEDGIVDCWECVDLALFRHKISIGWVMPEIPDGAELSRAHLAHMTVNNATWFMSAESLVERVEAIAAALNPAHNKLSDDQMDTEVGTGSTVVTDIIRFDKTTYKTSDGHSFLDDPVKGVANPVFWRLDDAVYVANVSLFEDDTVRITGVGAPTFLTLDELRQDERLSVATKGDRIQIPGLCSFIASDVKFTIPREGFLAQLEIDRDKAAGRKTVLERTKEAFESYVENPTTRTLEELRTVYESVPGHLRRYCGDMDTKDIPIRMALYGDNEIENWSHFALSKSLGQQLPSIKVPKPKKR